MSTAAKDPLKFYKTAGILIGPASVFVVIGALVQQCDAQTRSLERTDERLKKTTEDIVRLEERTSAGREVRADAQRLDGESHRLNRPTPDPMPPPILASPMPFTSDLASRPTISALARFTSPDDGHHTQNNEVSVGGTVDPGLSEALFLFICPELAVKCWPQSPEDTQGLPALRDGNTWRVVGYLGGPAQSYRLVLYSATAAAASKLSAYLRLSAERKQYPGLLPGEFPVGLKRLDEIKIFKDKT